MGGETSPEQQYSLRWNDFHASILSSFRHLRDEEDFVDVTLACDGCSFTAHKVVLSACSPYFRRLLKANPCQHPIVILRDVQQKDMESLLRFMYNGEVHIGQEQLTDFLKTAQMLQVRGLADVPAGSAGQRLTAADEKISPNSSSLPWATDQADAVRDGGLSPPPAKRSRSSEHIRGSYTPDRGRSPSRGNGDMRESLLGQALEGGPTIHTSTNKGQSDSSLQAQSTGEDSNSSDTALSDHGDPVTPKTEPSDYPMLDDQHPFNTNGGLLDQPRTPTFPGALLGLQGLQGLMPGPSGVHNNTADNFGSRGYQEEVTRSQQPQNRIAKESPSVSRGPEIEKVAETSVMPLPHGPYMHKERPTCPECGKSYSTLSNLKQHFANVHRKSTEVFMCSVCLKYYKTKQYLISHLSQTHVSRRSLDMMRVRATDPRPCPKCGKIYRSAHTLRTHLEDKHTICPGYRCVLCGTVAKSRNSLHSHMSRQHRGISTKDLPVLPMPAPFDPELASRLLAKAGVKVSPAELRARASPTGPRRSDMKLDAKSVYSGAPSEAGSSVCGDNDPEDLTISHQRSYAGLDLAMSPPMNHNPANMKISKIGSSGQAVAAKSIDSIAHNLSKEPYPAPLAPPVSSGNSTGSAILDTYLQFITENSLGMGMMSEQAAAAVHAAKMAQLNAMGLDKASQQHFLEKMQQQMGVANDLVMKRSEEIRRSDEDMVNNERDMDKDKDDGGSSGGEEDDYSEDEAEPEGVKAGE